MNCANHPQNPVAAYCRTCGKPLCSNCARQVMGVVYCENCLASRVAGAPNTSPPYVAGPGVGPRVQTTGPNPGLAGVLGAIPFGVGAIYNGQYTKGLVHLGIFVGLIVGLSSNLPGYMYPILGIALAFFVIYQIIDAVHTARAIQSGRPAPDPLGLATMFSPGDRVDFRHGAPAGAVILIVLGVLFLLNNLGIRFLQFDRGWPVFLIFLGVWLYAKRRMTPDGQRRSIAGPAVLVTIGVLSLIENLRGPGWDRTWPILLLVIGVIKLMERGYLGGPRSAPPMGPGPPSDSTVPPQPPTEINSEVKNG